jgi:hypothetical protein
MTKLNTIPLDHSYFYLLSPEDWSHAMLASIVGAVGKADPPTIRQGWECAWCNYQWELNPDWGSVSDPTDPGQHIDDCPYGVARRYWLSSEPHDAELHDPHDRYDGDESTSDEDA